ncbi:acetyl/propionyl/methylcrotonyl-CoA carboxylase subunit alpha [Egicoccus halophilus]|uniref:biotin carboxylase n=1 Tax=Egicoccus halophilus TaxID=1670830 RepID=A0A8J3A9J3_9ACTN|nr:biotin carboxylase N-terminal domain-containing protein [Egicoccus halophilus]GGI05266.1 putative acetyl/propionyl carboxylase alpha subunit AccA2 [Egicoccus halophilus]
MTSSPTSDPRPAATGPLRLPRKVLVANRGEIAVRIAATCRAMGIATVAVFSDADADALHVTVADEAVRLGGSAPADSYLRVDAVVAAARRTGADAVHPGYGFLSENAEAARTVADAGLTWVGPSPDVIAAMGDKLAAKRRLAAAGVPVVPGADLDDELSAAQLAQRADEVGYPLLVKAAAGGGGRGMRLVAGPDELSAAVDAARREAAAAFGNERVFLERFVARPRHLEVQVFGDVHGTVVHLFERECSIQRRHQKVVEEAPSVAIDPEVRAALTGAAVDAARAIGYVNAGTVEFVADETVLARRRAGEDVDPRTAFAFLEVNTRLQVEHPVTEQTVRVRGTVASDGGPDDHRGLDLVGLQLAIAAGAPLPFAQDELVQVGHAIEARLYAEDPVADHRPVPGPLHAFAPPRLPGVRWDVGVRAGDEVWHEYDPLLAKVIATGATREEAASRLSGALARTLLGRTTNRDLLVAILRDEAFLAGDTTTAFLDERFGTPALRRFVPDEATVRTAQVASALHRLLGPPPGQVPARVPPGFSNTAALPLQLRIVDPSHGRGAVLRVSPLRRAGAWWRVQVAADAPAGIWQDPQEVLEEFEARLHARTDDAVTFELDGHRRTVAVRTRLGGGADADEHTAALVDGRWVDLVLPARFPVPERRLDPGATSAPMPGTVTTVDVAPGEQVVAGDLLVTLEAMKMEHRVTATAAGTVAEVAVAPGDRVDADAVLVVLDLADPA